MTMSLQKGEISALLRYHFPLYTWFLAVLEKSNNSSRIDEDDFLKFENLSEELKVKFVLYNRGSNVVV